MFDSSYTQTLQDQIGQLSKLLGGQTAAPAALPVQQAASQYDYVSGIEGARAFQQKMLSGAKHIVWDNEKSVFYVLQKDANGAAGQTVSLLPLCRLFMTTSTSGRSRRRRR